MLRLRLLTSTRRVSRLSPPPPPFPLPFPQIEVGNSPDFSCGDDAAALARCQAHMSMWCALKSPLVLGNDIPNESPATLGVLSNAEAIAVNQDPWGVQARRVAVQAPRNGSLTASPADNVAVIAPCDAAEPTQAWTFVNRSGGPRDGLYLTPCDATDPYQQWVADAGGPTLRNVGSNACVDSAGRTDPGQVLPCDASKASQHWAPQPGSQHVANGAACLDVFNFAGPDVEIGSCKAPGAMDSNQVWVPLPGGLLRTNSTGAPAGSCLAVEAGPPGGVLRTTDALGATWCLTNRAGAEGEWGGGACDASDRGNSFDLQSRDGGKTWAIQGAGGSPSWNTQVGASGPHPHTRYISGYSWSGSSAVWLLDPTAPSTPITASDKTGIIDDDLVGHVTKGGAFCLQLSTGGLLEVWAGVLSPDARGRARLTVVLFNRSPGDDVVTVPWAAIGAPAGTAYAVRDIWAAADIGTFTGDFTRPVAAHSTAFLVLTATG